MDTLSTTGQGSRVTDELMKEGRQSRTGKERKEKRKRRAGRWHAPQLQDPSAERGVCVRRSGRVKGDGRGAPLTCRGDSTAATGAGKNGLCWPVERTFGFEVIEGVFGTIFFVGIAAVAFGDPL